MTRAQAAAAVKDVRKIMHVVQRYEGKTTLGRCEIVVGPGVNQSVGLEAAWRGTIRIWFGQDDRHVWNNQRKSHQQSGPLKTVRNLGAAAYWWKDEDNPWELHVFNPRPVPAPVPGPPDSLLGDLTVTPDDEYIPRSSLIAIARHALRYRA